MKNKTIEINENTVGIIIKSEKFGDRICEIDREDLPRVRAFSWSLVKSRKTIYAMSSTSLIVIKMHRLILSFPESNHVIDHVDNNGLNNKKSNLRTCSMIENSWNSGIHANNKTGFLGVTFNKKNQCFIAQIGFNKRKVYLGSFGKDPLRAAAAYNEAAKRFFGEFAKLNFI